MQPALSILGWVALFALCCCPAATLMSTIPSVLFSSSIPSPSSEGTLSTTTVSPEPPKSPLSLVPPPSSRIDLDEDDLRDSPALSGGSALESVNSSMSEGGFGLHIMQNTIQSSSSSSPNSSGGFEAQDLGNSTAGMYSGGSVSFFLNEDDLLLIPKKLMIHNFEDAEEEWLSTRKLLDERLKLTQAADSKEPIGTAFAFNAPNEQSIASPCPTYPRYWNWLQKIFLKTWIM